jgi:hypothetical protein
MKKLLVLVFVLSSVVMVQAQVQVALGLKAGVNVSKLNTDEVESSSITAFHGGAFGLFKFTAIGIQPELLFSQQGSKIEDINTGDTEDLKLSYMTIPVMLKFYLPGGFNLQAGPQFGFLNSAEFDGDNVKDSFKSSDITANVGIAWDAPFGLVLDARYNIGLSDVGDDSPYGELKGNTFQFSLGYKIIKLGK